MTDADIKRLRDLCNSATPGPWRSCDDIAPRLHLYAAPRSDNDTSPIEYLGQSYCDGAGKSRANMDFICAARSALPALLDRVEELERAVAIRDTTVRVLKENQALDAQRLAELNAAQAAVDAACIEHAELNGHIEIAEQALDWVAHERDLVDPSGKLEDFFKSLSVVIDQCEKQRRRANWHEAAHDAGKAKLIEQATTELLTARDKLAAECERLRALATEAARWIGSTQYRVDDEMQKRYAQSLLAELAAKEGLT